MPLSTSKKSDIYWLIAILVVFATVYSLLSLVNHYLLRTAALDLGMSQHALYCFAHFKANHFLLDPFGRLSWNFFGCHFAPIIFLFVPFYYVMGSYTLLIIQILSILAGGIGIYMYARLKFPEGYIPLLATFHFFGIWAIYSALGFDFHTNVIAAMLVPWFIYFHEKKQTKPLLLFFILIISTKENMALWMIFILLGLIVKNGLKNPKQYLKLEIPLILIATVYFTIITLWVMPAFENMQSDNFQFTRYSLLGDSHAKIISTLLNPRYIFSLLFENPYTENAYLGTKSEFHFMILVSGGLALIYRPWYLIMLLPIYLQKFLSNEPAFWSIHFQYSVEVAPILSIALVDFVEKYFTMTWKYIAVIACSISTHYFNISSMQYIYSLSELSSFPLQYYSAAHYRSNLPVNEIYKALELIPSDAPISVSSALSPHMADRDKIYSFPIIADAQYIAVLTKGNKYPLSQDEFDKMVTELQTSGNYSVLYNKYDFLILKKK